MVTVSLCMIVKNEEVVLARCLDSVEGLTDEIIIVDTGSTDRTKEIASGYTSKVFDFIWKDDFAAARNYSFSKAEMDYCMWLDADDIIEEPEKIKFLELKKTLPAQTDIVMMKYHTAFDENGAPVFSFNRERWIRNDSSHFWIGAVHEVIAPEGEIVYSDFAVSHRKIKPGDQDRNLKIYEKLMEEKTELEPRQQYYYGRELYSHERYGEAVEVFLAFLQQPFGWKENKIEACALCANCYLKLKQEEPALHMLLRSMEFDTPRAELCCDLGKYFLDREKYDMAVYWYETASEAEKDMTRGGFVSPDCYDYIPYLQLCVCYDKKGDRKKAREYNEKAGKYKPDSKAYLFNRQYFEKLEECPDLTVTLQE